MLAASPAERQTIEEVDRVDLFFITFSSIYLFLSHGRGELSATALVMRDKVGLLQKRKKEKQMTRRKCEPRHIGGDIDKRVSTC